jgi:cathepsin C
LIESKN